MKEIDLYKPVKTLFTNIGYSVKGEVKDVDLVATSDDGDIVIMVEFKLQFGLKLILQAINRQKMTDFVYVAIPKPPSKVMKSKGFKEKIHLLRRLELGLIFVTIEPTHEYAQIIEEPRPYSRTIAISRNKRKKESILAEMNKRHGDFNLGGTNGKVMTAYREQALIIAYYLKDGPKTVADIRELTHNDKAGTILLRNYYNWYEPIERGIYAISYNGLDSLEVFADLLSILIPLDKI